MRAHGLLAWGCLALAAGKLAADGPAEESAARPPVTALAFAPTESLLVAGSQAGLQILAWPSLHVQGELSTDLVQIHDLEFSPDGRLLAVAGGSPSESGGVELFHWPERKLIRRAIIHDDVAYAVAWQRDGTAVALAGGDEKVSVVALAESLPPQILEGHSQAALAAAFLDDGALVTAGVDGSLRMWSAKGELVRTLANHTRSVHDLAARPLAAGSEAWIASASDDRTVRFWQPAIGRMIRFARLPSAPLALAWGPGGAAVVAACRDGHIRQVDPNTCAVLADLPATRGVAFSLAAADGGWAVGGQEGQIVRVVLP